MDSLVTEVFPGYGYIESDSSSIKVNSEGYKINKTARNVKRYEVKVLGYANGGYILDRTILHYQGGGQPGDRGMLEIVREHSQQGGIAALPKYRTMR